MIYLACVILVYVLWEIVLGCTEYQILSRYTENAGVAAHVNAATKLTSLTAEISHDRIQVDF